MTTKYYLKEKCDGFWENTHQHYSCNKSLSCDCEGKGFTRGADVTELMERIFAFISYNERLQFLELNKDLIEVAEE